MPHLRTSFSNLSFHLFLITTTFYTIDEHISQFHSVTVSQFLTMSTHSAMCNISIAHIVFQTRILSHSCYSLLYPGRKETTCISLAYTHPLCNHGTNPIYGTNVSHPNPNCSWLGSALNRRALGLGVRPFEYRSRGVLAYVGE